MRVCSQCKIEKPLDSFHKDKSNLSGYRCNCKDCCKIYYTSERSLELCRKRNKTEKRKNYLKIYHKRPEIKILERGNHLRRYWPGITGKQAYARYEEIFKSQNGKCLLCHINQKDINRVFDVDHCHKTGKVRGLLCNNCNKFVGFLEKNTELFVKIEKYIKLHKEAA